MQLRTYRQQSCYSGLTYCAAKLWYSIPHFVINLLQSKMAGLGSAHAMLALKKEL